jgi:hypothetical protein
MLTLDIPLLVVGQYIKKARLKRAIYSVFIPFYLFGDSSLDIIDFVPNSCRIFVSFLLNRLL